MKRFITLFFLCTCFIVTQAQNHVFVLVDVSASRNSDKNLKLEAKNQIYNLLTGQYSANGWVAKNVTDKQINANINATQPKPLITQNSWFFLMPFGNKSTYKNYQKVQIKSYPSDFDNLFNNAYPTKFPDGLTFMKVAEAFTVSLAKSYNIPNYYIFEITDAMEDNTGSNNPYDQYEEDLLTEYNNEQYSIVRNIGTLTKNKYYIRMFKVDNVQASKIQPAPGIKPEVVNATAIIKISAPIGKKNKEAELKSENMTVSWTCTNCPEGIKYSVSISGYDGNNFKDTRKDLTVNTTTFNNLSSGKYRVTVSASNYSANSDTTYVSVNTGSFGWILFILLLAAVGGTAYYLWNKRRQAKIETSTFNNNPNDIFSQNSGTITSNSSNSDYF